MGRLVEQEMGQVLMEQDAWKILVEKNGVWEHMGEHLLEKKNGTWEHPVEHLLAAQRTAVKLEGLVLLHGIAALGRVRDIRVCGTRHIVPTRYVVPDVGIKPR